MLERKYRNLRESIGQLGAACVAFSGGVDSTLLAKVCQDVLGTQALAVTIDAPMHPEREVNEARELAQAIGIRHHVIEWLEITTPQLRDNDVERCYYCKRDVFLAIKAYASTNGITHILDGSNVDDLSDYRPGMRALQELGVQSPLQEANLTKDEIRQLSRDLGLPTWDKPGMACLATRFPYGEAITREKLTQVEQAENFLMDQGFRQFRVRHHEDIARIEVSASERQRMFDEERLDTIAHHLRGLGYSYVTMDLVGYEMGSMNRGLGSNTDSRNKENPS